MKLIKWTNTGPVPINEIEVDESGGLYVLEGPCGSGKSHLLAALDDAINPEHKSSIPVLDGAARAEVEIFGELTLRKSKNATRRGVLECNTLAGKFSVADLVDPKIDSPIAADAKRIKALIQLKGDTKADPSLFYSLVGGQKNFDEYVPSDYLATEDLVVMSAKVKAAFEKAARDLEERYKKRYAEAEAARLSSAGVDTNLPHDADELAAQYEAATREDSRLQEAKQSYQHALVNQNRAKEALAQHTKGFARLPVGQAQDKEQEALAVKQDARDLVEDLKFRLNEAEKKLVKASHLHELAEKTLEASEKHYSTLGKFQSLADTQLPEPVADSDLLAAQENVRIARQVQEQGVRIRLAIDGLKNARQRKSEAAMLEAKALQFRDAAQATDSVLASVVKDLGLPLTVSGGRLWITNSDRNETKMELFSDLSKGERCALVIDIAIEAVKQPGRQGLFVVPQEFFEGLDESHQFMVARKLDGTGVVAITAKAKNGDGITVTQVKPVQVEPISLD